MRRYLPNSYLKIAVNGFFCGVVLCAPVCPSVDEREITDKSPVMLQNSVDRLRLQFRKA